MPPLCCVLVSKKLPTITPRGNHHWLGSSWRRHRGGLRRWSGEDLLDGCLQWNGRRHFGRYQHNRRQPNRHHQGGKAKGLRPLSDLACHLLHLLVHRSSPFFNCLENKEHDVPGPLRSDGLELRGDETPPAVDQRGGVATNGRARFTCSLRTECSLGRTTVQCSH